MHKFYDYACKELDELENKIDKGLSATEFEYAIKLMEFKKNLLKVEKLEGDGYLDDEMSFGMNPYYRGMSYGTDSYRSRGMSYGRGDRSGANRGSRRSGHYVGSEDFIEQLEDLLETAKAHR